MSAVKRSRAPRGLTLVELVFVVAILAILAGALVPRLGTVRNLAADASNADQTAAALNQAVLYNVEQNVYPAGEDTLIAANGTNAGALYGNLDAGLSALLTPKTLDAAEAKSINTQLTFDTTGGTPTYLFNNDTAGTEAAGDSGGANSVGSTPVTTGTVVAQVTIPTAITGTTYSISDLLISVILG